MSSRSLEKCLIFCADDITQSVQSALIVTGVSFVQPLQGGDGQTVEDAGFSG